MLKLHSVCYLTVYKMSNYVEGKLIYPKHTLNLDLTLLGGQSFRWEKQLKDERAEKWQGVVFDCFWELSQTPTTVSYKVFCNTKHPEDFYIELLKNYFRLNFDLNANCEKWKNAHKHFAETSEVLKAVRVLDQEPLETIISFICSQNNHIKRESHQWYNGCVHSMVEKYVHMKAKTILLFPAWNPYIIIKLESTLRAAKFGYRSKFISGSVRKIHESGGTDWLNNLRTIPYIEARQELVTLPGIGFKVADCICLMALGHLESVPIDTHIFKIAQSSYLPRLSSVKSVTPKIYEEVADHFRKIYGQYAGWAQAVLFCSGLLRFQESNEKSHQPQRKKKK